MTPLSSNLLSFFGGSAVVIIAVAWLFHNLEKVERIVAWFFRTFSWLRKKWEYKNVATNIQAVVNTLGESLEKEASGVLPHAMKIEWARNATDAESFLRGGNIIVSLEYSPNRARNLVVSTLSYLRSGLLPKARPYMDATLLRATDFTIAKRIFATAEDSLAIPFFFEHYTEPETVKDEGLGTDCAAFDRIQEAGYMTRIFLTELGHAAESVFPATPDSTIKQEIREFAHFLDEIVSESRGERSAPLAYLRSRIRVSLLLVARPNSPGTSIYARRIQLNIARGIEYMYICAVGSRNIQLARQVAEEQKDSGQLEILSEQLFRAPFEGVQKNVMCIACALTLLAPSQAAEDPARALYPLLEETIEEIRDGRIEIVELVREPGIGSKILVRSRVRDLDAVACCTDPDNLYKMRTLLDDERLDFVDGTDDTKRRIVSSLAPLDSDDVRDVVLDREKGEAVVEVDGWKARRKALGKGDENLLLAGELTGWIIRVEDIADEGQES